MATLEDHERRIARLEAAQTARGDNAVARLEREVKALPREIAEIVAEQVTDLRTELNERIDSIGGALATLQTDVLRIDDKIDETVAAVRHLDTRLDAVDKRFEAVMAALDRLQGSSK